MEITFLGTGGGRFNLLTQDRKTGGFRIDSQSASIHVDPGPGALLNSLKMKLSPQTLDALIVTHYHVDHCTDANVFVEGMTDHLFTKKGILIGSAYSIEGDSAGDRGVSKYHSKHVERCAVAEWGKKEEFKTAKGSFSIEYTKTVHDEPTCFGFKLTMDGKTIGYTSDTTYFDELGSLFRGCDLFIPNCLKPKQDQYNEHLTADNVVDILETARPKKTYLNHMGMTLIKTGPKKVARYIAKKSGLHCEAADDFKTIKVE